MRWSDLKEARSEDEVTEDELSVLSRDTWNMVTRMASMYPSASKIKQLGSTVTNG